MSLSVNFLCSARFCDTPDSKLGNNVDWAAITVSAVAREKIKRNKTLLRFISRGIFLKKRNNNKQTSGP